MDKLIVALGPAFAAGFALQQLLEILDSPAISKIKMDKKFLLGIVSLVYGLALAFGAGIRVLLPLGITNADFLDGVVTALIISAGTEGANSVIKFLGYTKDKQNPDKNLPAGK